MTEPLSAVFHRPFDQQVAAFRLRLGNLVPTKNWDDIQRNAHDRAFMVAGAMKADLLSDLAAAVDKAIAEGTGLETFRKDFRSIVERHGWHGWTGEGSKAGEAWRTRVIYRTNLSTTYAAGRRAQLIEGGFKYWVYRHGGSAHPRLHHLELDGLILPADHPAWAKLFPPNDWGCSCYVVGARSINGARRVGGNPKVSLPGDWEEIDPKTGTIKRVGKGWDYAPGSSVNTEIRTLAEKPVNWLYSLAVAYMRSLPENVRDQFSQSYRLLPSTRDAFRQFARSAADNAKGNQPDLRTLGLATRGQVAQIERLTGANLQKQLWDFSVEWHALRHSWNRHSVQKIELSRGQRALEPDDFAMLPLLVDQPDSIQLGNSELGKNQILRFERVIGDERFVALFEVRPGRRRLSLKTMWVEQIAGTPLPHRP